MPWIGVSRSVRGWSLSKLSICCRISGDALSKNQESPSALTATDSCVRASARMLPRRTPTQFGQPQFHCGKPPPAAEPKTRMNTFLLPAAEASPASERQRPCDERLYSETVVVFSLVRTNLCAHVDLFEARRFPVHDRAFQVDSQSAFRVSEIARTHRWVKTDTFWELPSKVSLARAAREACGAERSEIGGH